MRLFVALDIPEETRRALDELIPRFAAACRGARWVRPDNLHVTLKFIGHWDETKLNDVKSNLAEISSPASIEIAFREFGFFPNDRHPRVFWVGMQAGPALADLAAQIEAKLQPLGVPHEERGFRPHLTLARFNSTQGLPKLKQMIAGLPSQEFGVTKAQEFYLYQSILKPRGAEYTRLATFAFAKGGG
jgi:RNA 2',3'-cyclic 3'-phosphodiesterase